MRTYEHVRCEASDGGQIWRVVLDAPKANVIDAAMTAELTAVFQEAAAAARLKAVLMEGEGSHFSFGASVEEHLPDQVADMLRAFHGLFRTIAASAVPLVVVVRGQCLGGGLELAAFGHRVFAGLDAQLGQPEIRLGVLAPAASVILPERVGRAAADDLCLTGRVVGADEALAMGLVDVVADDPREAALAWIAKGLLPHSAASLRRAVRAVRWGLDRKLSEDLDAIERLYLEDLMATADATEGIRAFLEKRRPVWSDA